jgi:prephenate dehydrogenase
VKEDDFAVIGLGLIGGSIGAALRSAGKRVRGFDGRAAHASIALSRGLVDEASTDLRAALNGCHVAIIALPVLAIIEFLPEVARAAPKNAVIIDTGSVKTPVVDAMTTISGPERAIGGHPIAGRESSGPREATADLFVGKTFVLSPTGATDERTLEIAHAVVRSLGGRPLIMDAGEHDRVIARTSDLPQILSTLLALVTDLDDRPLTGSGFRDMTRLALSDASMWRDILLANQTAIVEAGRAYGLYLERFLDAMQSRDVGALEHMMTAARSRAEHLRQESAA